MNCIEKMYKEIDEIIKKEELEQSRSKFLVKEIKYSFNDEDNEIDPPTTKTYDYLEQISFENLKIDKKYFSEEKAKSFITHIFKKFLVFNPKNEIGEEFFNEISSKIIEDDLISTLKNLENEFINKVGDSEIVKNFFTNPYNALYKDENGYFAVILNGKYSDIKRPLGFNLNQLKKLIKESVDVYVEDFSGKINAKEKATLINFLKAEINKSDLQDSEKLEEMVESKLLAFLEKHEVGEQEFKEYVLNKGLKLIKQNNYYFRKKAYEEYAEYKKIEFRY